VNSRRIVGRVCWRPSQKMPDYQASFGLDTEADLFTAVAEGFHDLARSLDGVGLPVVGLRLHEAASMLDLGLRQRGWWTNGFNGQEGRGRLFRRILDTLRPAALIETGTFRGSTTAIMAQQFGGPIFTCEVDPRWFLTSKATLEQFPRVDVRNLDSRGFLRTILPEVAGDPLFYYLDAHWQDDLPLPEEIEFILSRGRPAVIMIDDFAVPWDAGYAFDDYGPGKALTIDLLARIENRGAALFFPTLPAEQETGARRGCAVIATAGVVAVIDELPELRRHDWPVPATARDVVTGTARTDVAGTARDVVAASARDDVPGTAENNAAPAPAKAAPPDLSPLRLFATSRGQEQERDALRGALHHAAAEREALLQEHDTLIQKRDALVQERDTLRDALRHHAVERDALLQKRDALIQERATLRDALRHHAVERDALLQERDALIQERDTLRDALRRHAVEQDAFLQERDALIRERATLLREHDTLLGERDTLLGEQSALCGQRDLLMNDVDALRNSTSWRITKPLRELGRLVRRRGAQ
jgi:predicted O-methyltransferase YrrM/uncharacterized coiled-coil DUF342 family protein